MIHIKTDKQVKLHVMFDANGLESVYAAMCGIQTDEGDRQKQEIFELLQSEGIRQDPIEVEE